jgi:hypothetical protein
MAASLFGDLAEERQRIRDEAAVGLTSDAELDLIIKGADPYRVQSGSVGGGQFTSAAGQVGTPLPPKPMKPPQPPKPGAHPLAHPQAAPQMPQHTQQPPHIVQPPHQHQPVHGVHLPKPKGKKQKPPQRIVAKPKKLKSGAAAARDEAGEHARAASIHAEITSLRGKLTSLEAQKAQLLKATAGASTGRGTSVSGKKTSPAAASGAAASTAGAAGAGGASGGGGGSGKKMTSRARQLAAVSAQIAAARAQIATLQGQLQQLAAKSAAPELVKANLFDVPLAERRSEIDARLWSRLGISDIVASRNGGDDEVVEKRWRYNPAEPRDRHGRWMRGLSDLADTMDRETAASRDAGQANSRYMTAGRDFRKAGQAIEEGRLEDAKTHLSSAIEHIDRAKTRTSTGDAAGQTAKGIAIELSSGSPDDPHGQPVPERVTVPADVTAAVSPVTMTAAAGKKISVKDLPPGVTVHQSGRTDYARRAVREVHLNGQPIADVVEHEHESWKTLPSGVRIGAPTRYRRQHFQLTDPTARAAAQGLPYDQQRFLLESNAKLGERTLSDAVNRAVKNHQRLITSAGTAPVTTEPADVTAAARTPETAPALTSADVLGLINDKDRKAYATAISQGMSHDAAVAEMMRRHELRTGTPFGAQGTQSGWKPVGGVISDAPTDVTTVAPHAPAPASPEVGSLPEAHPAPTPPSGGQLKPPKAPKVKPVLISPADLQHGNASEMTRHQYPSKQQAKYGVKPRPYRALATRITDAKGKHMGLVDTWRDLAPGYGKLELGSRTLDLNAGASHQNDTRTMAERHAANVEQAKRMIAGESNAKRARAALSAAGHSPVRYSTTAVKGWHNIHPGYEVRGGETGLSVEHIGSVHGNHDAIRARRAEKTEEYARALEAKGVPVKRVTGDDGQLKGLSIKHPASAAVEARTEEAAAPGSSAPTPSGGFDRAAGDFGAKTPPGTPRLHGAGRVRAPVHEVDRAEFDRLSPEAQVRVRARSGEIYDAVGGSAHAAWRQALNEERPPVTPKAQPTWHVSHDEEESAGFPSGHTLTAHTIDYNGHEITVDQPHTGDPWRYRIDTAYQQ